MKILTFVQYPKKFDPSITSSQQTKSIFDEFLLAQLNNDVEAVRILRPLRLRYFTPTELLRLFHFESHGQANCKQGEKFRWPKGVTTKTKYRLIGNSVNVKVVAELINFLFQSNC